MELQKRLVAQQAKIDAGANCSPLTFERPSYFDDYRIR